LNCRPKKRLKRDKPDALVVPDTINECWSMDFMHDQLGDGRSFRLFNVIEWRGKPKRTCSDNGPEYISDLLKAWAAKQDVMLDFIQPGNPQQNAYVERYNRTVRYDWLAQYIFNSIHQEQEHPTRWLWTYKNERPNMANGDMTPIQKLALAA